MSRCTHIEGKQPAGLANSLGVHEGMVVKDGKSPSFPELSPWLSGDECKPN